MLCCQFVFCVSLNLCKVADNLYLVIGFYAVNANRNVSSHPCARTVEIIVFAITVNLKAAIDNYQRVVYFYLNRERTLAASMFSTIAFAIVSFIAFMLCNVLIFDCDTNVI